MDNYCTVFIEELIPIVLFPIFFIGGGTVFFPKSKVTSASALKLQCKAK